jgi:hypothetical protein
MVDSKYDTAKDFIAVTLDQLCRRKFIPQPRMDLVEGATVKCGRGGGIIPVQHEMVLDLRVISTGKDTVPPPGALTVLVL